MLRGACHCGTIAVELDTRADPRELPLRACSCTFCRKHGARTISDPAGRVRIALSGEVSRYRWGLATADFLVCARCGVYAGAVLRDGALAWAVINTRILEDQSPFQREELPVSYDGEAAQDRIARRKLLWTPAEIVTRDAALPSPA